MPNKSDAPSEEIKKASGDWDEIKKLLVTTIGTVVKQGTIETVDKSGNNNLMWWRNPSLQFQQKRKFTQSTKQRNHKNPKNSPFLKKNKPDTLNSIYKSRSTQITDTVNTIEKSRSIPGNNLSNRSTKI